MYHDGLQRLADGLSRRLDRSVTIDDPRLGVLVYSVLELEADSMRLDAILRRRTPAAAASWLLDRGISTADAPLRIPGNPELDQLPRVCAPIRSESQLLGYLWVIDRGSTLTDDDLAQIAREADSAGRLLRRERVEQDGSRLRQGELLGELISAKAARRAAAAEELVDTEVLDRPTDVVVLVAALDGTVDGSRTRAELVAAVDHALREVPGRRRLTRVRSTEAVVVLSGQAAQTLGQVADGLHRAVADRFSGRHVTVRVGVGEAAPTLEEVHRSARQARAAVRIVGILPGLGPVARYGELGVYRMLAALREEELTPDMLDAGLHDLLEEPSAVMARTLEVYLDLGCDATATASALQVHRTTVYYRLGRIQELTGADLDDGRQRLALHLGLKLAHLMGLVPPD